MRISILQIFAKDFNILNTFITYKNNEGKMMVLVLLFFLRDRAHDGHKRGIARGEVFSFFVIYILTITIFFRFW